MATRIYLPSSGAAAVSPAYDAAWERTSDAARLACVTTKLSTAMTTANYTIGISEGDENDVLCRQYVSTLLGAQTITGTVKGQIRSSVTNASLNARAQMIVRVVSGDGLTFRGTLMGPDTSSVAANSFTTSLTNRKYPKGSSGFTLSSVAAQAGDRLVIELGAHNNANPNIVGAGVYAMRIGDTGGTDLAEDESTTTDNVPWIEFSQTLTMFDAQGSATITGTGGLEVLGLVGPDTDLQVAVNF